MHGVARSFEQPDDATSFPNATQQASILTFHVSVPSVASPEAVYDVLSDPRTHLTWAGEQSPRKGFRLLTMDAVPRPAVVGDRFSSSGANVNGTFHDTSVVVEADRGERFGFDTESTLDRKHGERLHVLFAHRYELRAAGGTLISYSCETRPQNYVPYWLKPGMRRMTRMNVEHMMRANMRNLAAMAEAGA